MAETLGRAFKQLRKKRHYTLAQAASDVISTSQLSRFENDHQDIGINTLIPILDNIGSSLMEMRMLQLNGDADSLLERTLDIARKLLWEEDNDDKSKIYGQAIYDQYRDNIVLKLVGGFLMTYPDSKLENLTDRQFAKSIHQQARNYLGNLDQWGFSDLTLYNLFSFSFSSSTLHDLMPQALKRANFYREDYGFPNIYMFILNTNFSIFVSNQELDWAKEALELQKTMIKEHASDSIFAQTSYLFNKGLLAFREGKIANGKKLAEQAISISKSLQQDKASKMFTTRYHRWLAHLDDPNFKDYFI